MMNPKRRVQMNEQMRFSPYITTAFSRAQALYKPEKVVLFREPARMTCFCSHYILIAFKRIKKRSNHTDDASKRALKTSVMHVYMFNATIFVI